MAVEVIRTVSPESIVLRFTGVSLQYGLDKAIAHELADAIERFVANDETLRVKIQQKIDEAFAGINVAAIVTKVCTEIAVGAAKHAMERTQKEFGVNDEAH